ncbi:TPA: Dam family site-specific DNA-(adenine-N6)-methyltransferase [Candidatus Poribacteria bacterium]|nr:Dam family site-specific DNA-(adenine-N6)-methyltransferase [Candidatus Poribacteria bacterium]
MNAKPFLKWAGGKNQILYELESRIPLEIRKSGIIDRYVEPFVGGGAFFFLIKNKYEIKQTFLIDINKELILAYKTIKKNPLELIQKLKNLEESFFKLSNKAKKGLFYEIRRLYNNHIKIFDYDNFNDDWIERSAFLIFLNKTCFNGLFRQNRKGEFNVPYGDYKNPKICDAENIIEVSNALKYSEIINGDFEISEKFIEKGTFVYFDPPYRPLNKTSAFTRYSKEDFNDEDQKRLAIFYRQMSDRGAYLMLSNSDPKNQNPDDNFFDELYKDFNIDRVLANRMINCNGDKRGKIKEIVITNYK